MRIYTGTSGYSYAEWKGVFYPPKLASKNMLSYYASKLRTVEINNTFYRMPRSHVIEAWASQVGDGFLFGVKAPRRITHFKKLAECVDQLDSLFDSLRGFEEKLGPVLLQTPPTLKADVPRLRAFLDDWQASTSTHLPGPRPPRCAFEFRHKTWFTDEVYELLSDRNVALVGGDLDDANKSPPVVKTGSHAYLRLRKTEYRPGEIEAWAERIVALNVEEAFVYFKHEQTGPALALQLEAALSSAR